MKWFKHDTDASQDAKLKKLVMQYGAEGLGFYWYCVERIAAKLDKDHVEFYLEDDIETIAHDLWMKSARVQELLSACVNIRLFVMNGENQPLCIALAKRLDNTMIQNPQIKEILTSSEFKSLKETLNNFKSLKETCPRTEQTRTDKTRLEQNITMSGQAPDSVDAFIQKEQKKAKKVPYSEIVEHLNTAANKQFSPRTQATQNLLKARWNEGYRVPDFKAVIDVKTKQWLNDPKMVSYLRPQTLFGTKFESYLNESRQKVEQDKAIIVCSECGMKNGYHIDSCSKSKKQQPRASPEDFKDDIPF